MVPEPRSAYAIRFVLLATCLLVVATCLSMILVRLIPSPAATHLDRYSFAFTISSGLLFAGSGCLYFALESVKRERQYEFRRWLMAGLAAGTLFVAVQSYALTCLIRQQPADEGSLGASAFVAVCAALHGMHFVIAFLFLCHVTIQALADRYDHEYFWGVIVCSWFWHTLGIAWLAILCVMMVARFYG